MSEWLEILYANDEEGCIQYPSSYNFTLLRKEVRQLVISMSSTLDLQFAIAESQDSTFYADVDSYPNASELTIRISNFGMLATMWSHSNTAMLQNPIILTLLKNHGFVYIPVEFLNKQSYDGNNNPTIFSLPPGQTVMTWWDRYFDYL